VIPVQTEVRPEDEVAYLEDAAVRLEADLKAVRDRIEELKKASQ
jgi:hypothetical protein